MRQVSGVVHLFEFVTVSVLRAWLLDMSMDYDFTVRYPQRVLCRSRFASYSPVQLRTSTVVSYTVSLFLQYHRCHCNVDRDFRFRPSTDVATDGPVSHFWWYVYDTGCNTVQADFWRFRAQLFRSTLRTWVCLHAARLVHADTTVTWGWTVPKTVRFKFRRCLLVAVRSGRCI